MTDNPAVNEVKPVAPVAPQGAVTLKPSAIEPQPVNPAGVGKNAPLPVYHTVETAKLADQRAKELEGKEDKPYEYHFNGYTVKEVDGAVKGVKLFEVTADGFSLTLADKRDAEIYVETHAPFVKNDQPSLKSSAVTSPGVPLPGNSVEVK